MKETTIEPTLPGGNVRNSVLAALGEPPDLYEVTVKSLWENHYRVNILTGPNAGSLRIAHSYFVEVEANGDIRSATPRITKLYA